MFIGIGTTLPEITNLPGQTGKAIPLDIFYLSNAFCSNASDPTPTVIGNKGAGTFSSTNGIVFADSGTNTNSSTGVIDISASTAGATYTITYTDIDAATDTFVLTLNLLDDATFAYSDTLYFQSTSTPTPTVNLPGGTFTAGAGLVFLNSSTGQISLDQSTVGNYTITYTTSGICPNTSTQALEIRALAQVDNIYSMSFDGINDFIDVGNDSSLSPTSQLSVSAWVNNTGAGTGTFPCIISNNSSSANNGGFALVKNLNKWKFYLDTTGSSGWATAESNGTVVSNSWQHLCATWDGSTVIMYLNGQAQTTTASASQIVYNADTETIIGEYAASYFQGKIDEVAVFDTALTEEQVLAIYEETDTGKTANLDNLTTPPVAWYRMGD